MICYAFFSGIATEHLDAFVLRMDSYVMGGKEEGYIKWIGQNIKNIFMGMNGGRLVLSTSFLLSIIRSHNLNIISVG
jgi:hypothetical protein